MSRLPGRATPGAVWVLLSLAPMLLLWTPASAETPLPVPTADNTLRILVLDPGLDSPDLTLAQKVDRAQQIVGRLDPGGLYISVGLAVPARMKGREVYEAAAEAGVPLAAIAGAAPHHTQDWLSEPLTADLRNAQWLSDGTLGPGAAARRSWASPSAYAKDVAAARRAYTIALGQRLAGLRAEVGGPDLCIGPMEVTLSCEGYPEAVADYGPRTVAEFRDWLTRRGAYALGGELDQYACPESARYADDPSPDASNDGHESFNNEYGTRFTTWKLRRYDPDAWPGPVGPGDALVPTDNSAAVTSGGFDAPRIGYASAEFAEAWLEFRRMLVRRWTEDHVRWLEEAGLDPRAICPTVFLPPDEDWRRLAGTGLVPRTEGPVVFDGAVDDVLAAACQAPLARWGAAISAPTAEETAGWTAQDALRWLSPVAEAGCRIILIWSWDEASGGHGLVAGTALEGGLRQLALARRDLPIGSDAGTTFAPPAVREVAIERRGGDNLVTWSPRVFEGREGRWMDWGPFLEFVVVRTGPTVATLGTTRDCAYVDVSGPSKATYEVRVRYR